MISALAWFLIFHLSGGSDSLLLAQVIVSALLILLADAFLLGKLSGPRMFLTTWLPLAALGVWTLTRSDPLGAIGAITYPPIPDDTSRWPEWA